MSEFAREYDEAVAHLAEVMVAEEYALIGGLAVTFYGVLRTTRDIDLLIAIPRIRLPAVLDALRARGFSFEDRQVLTELRDNYLTHIQYREVRVDLLAISLPAYAGVVRGAAWKEIHGRRIRVATAEGLILMKLLSFRDMDRADLWGILIANRETLDLDLLRTLYSQVGKFTDERWQTFERMLREVMETKPRP